MALQHVFGDTASEIQLVAGSRKGQKQGSVVKDTLTEQFLLLLEEGDLGRS